jgi:2-isopropylmalate synthase
MNRTVEIYDTTLRDGTQQEGISLTVKDKLKICSLLDDLGVAYIEGGWPGANPKEDEFFARARTELDLDTATLCSPRRQEPCASSARPGTTTSSMPCERHSTKQSR